MRELKVDTFSGNKNDDAHEHVKRILDIFSLFNIPRVTHDVVMLRVFPITLSKAAKRWVDRLTPGKINTWDLLKKELIERYLPPSKIAKQLEDIHNFKQEGDETLYQHGKDEKKCGGAHLDRECPLREEVKSVEEVKYREFGRPFPNNDGNEAIYHVGLPGYYTRVDNRPPFGEKKPSLEELMNKHLEDSTRRRLEMEEWMKKLQDSTEINTRNQDASLKNMETQIEQLEKYYQAKVANEVPSSSIGQCKSIFANDDASNDETSSNGTNKLHGVSFIDDDVQVSKETDKVQSEVFPCQLPPKELSPRSFTLPCTIDSLNLYVVADLGASIDQLGNKYELKIGKMGYILDDVWEKCEQVHEGTPYLWHDEGLEEEERWEVV
ncbi:DNA-binding pseudobarrel domain-containing protein [Tanacetum coccineum]|uniref:DNA-binding pseudobarrel domain-containing protein n=1 Tax=Tanacetum coccineum TaxID=301880 RepID=A0ABQ4YPE6_9ASTR